ncbi:unnamed protein product [Gordionus sp. m RMFG-2023]
MSCGSCVCFDHLYQHSSNHLEIKTFLHYLFLHIIKNKDNNKSIISYQVYCIKCKKYLASRNSDAFYLAITEIVNFDHNKIVQENNSGILLMHRNNINKVGTTTHLRGLQNLGNTCFFNSIMQTMTHTVLFCEALKFYDNKNLNEEQENIINNIHKNNISNGKHNLVEYLLKKEQIVNGEAKNILKLANSVSECEIPLISSTNKFLKNMSSITIDKAQSQLKTINPNELINAFYRKYPFFERGAQQDSHEFLLLFLDSIREEEILLFKMILNKLKLGINKLNFLKCFTNNIDKEKINQLLGASNIVYSSVNHIFGGKFLSTLKCENCHKINNVIEPFLDVSLSIPNIVKKISTTKRVANNIENYYPILAIP